MPSVLLSVYLVRLSVPACLYFLFLLMTMTIPPAAAKTTAATGNSTPVTGLSPGFSGSVGLDVPSSYLES